MSEDTETRTATTSNGQQPGGRKKPIPPRFRDCGEFVEQWLAPIIVRKMGKSRTWCAQWWRHQEVVVRFDALWRGWEAARGSDDKLAMSAWWVYHADAHLRTILDRETGPLHLCDLNQHREPAGLECESIPPGWLDHGRHRDTRLIPAPTTGQQ